jgi:hypothetical protein
MGAELSPFSLSQPAWNDLRGKLVGSETYARRQLSDIRYIVVHHSGIDVDSTAPSIAQYHVNTKGWPGIAYHFLVHWNGGVDYVGDIETVRYNVAGRNRECLGVCLPGDFSARIPSQQQLDSCLRLVSYLRWLLPNATVAGHRDLALKGFESECPGATWPEWRIKSV